MERIIDLAAVLQHEVADYVRPSPNADLYYLENPQQRLYSVVAIPNYGARKPLVVLMARIKDDHIIIETDTTSNPLYEELRRAGVPDDQITLAYEGETFG